MADLEVFALQQEVSPVKSFKDLLGGFWPEDESVDEFIEELYRWYSADTSIDRLQIKC